MLQVRLGWKMAEQESCSRPNVVRAIRPADEGPEEIFCLQNSSGTFKGQSHSGNSRKARQKYLTSLASQHLRMRRA